MFNATYGAAVAALLALCPGLVRLAWGPVLSRLADDPELPERLARFNRRVAVVSIVCLAALGASGHPWWLTWALPLSIVAQYVGGFPLRKTLYQETWSLVAFLSFFSRLSIGMRGFGMLAAVTPLLAAAAGRFDVFVALGLGVLLLAWAHDPFAVCRAMLGVEPIADRALLDRFAALAAKASVPAPRFEAIVMNGGVFPNAFALPSPAGASSVAITDTLLSRLTADENVAICAHEIAHLEDFARGRLRRQRQARFALAVAAAALAPVARWIAGPADLPWLILWPLAIVAAPALTARKWQPVEHASDARAVELTGDPESLVSALTKLHAIALFPRRWDRQFEQTASHPSLEERIKNIRRDTPFEASDTPRVPFSILVTRMVAGLACGLAILLGQTAFAIAALVACVTPAAPLLWAAGAAGLAAAVLLATGESGLRGIVLLCSLLAAALFGVAWVRRRDSVRGSRVMFALLVLGTAAVVASLAAGGIDPIRLHQAVRSTPAPGVLLVACAVAFWTWHQRPVLRFAAMISTVGALTVFAIGTTAFLDGAGRDPFLLAASPFAPATITSAPVTEFSVPFEIDILRVSPHGRLAAFTREESDERSNESRTATYSIGGSGGLLPAVEGHDLAFIDDERALVLMNGERSSEVRDVTLASSSVGWRLTLPDLVTGTLTYDRGSRRWTVLGDDHQHRTVRLSGILGDTDLTRTVWTIPRSDNGWVDGLTSRGTTLLAVEHEVEHRLLGRGYARWLPRTLNDMRTHSDIWRVQDGAAGFHGRSLLETSCGTHTIADGRLVCAAFDGTRSRVLTLDPDTGSATAIGTLDGRFLPEDVQPGEWVTGWTRRGIVALRLSTREAFQRDGNDDVYAIAATDAVVGTASWDERGGSRIRIYPLAK